MNVVLTSHFSPWSRYSGGGQGSAHYLAAALAARGHAVTVVFTRAALDAVAVPQGLPYRVEWARFPGVRSRRASPLRGLAAWPLARIVGGIAGPGGIVHANGEEAAFLPAARPYPLVVTPRYPRYPEHVGRWPLGKFRMLARALRHANAICPTSLSAAEAVSRAFGIAPGRMHVVPNGITPAFFDARRAPGAADGPLLFFGRLEASKGLDVLLDALALLGPDARPAVVVGRGDDAAWRARAEALGARVTFAGWRSPEDLARMLETASVAVLPSREESFGNSIAEALAAGCPVVSARAGSVPDLVRDGETGWLVPPGDARALAAALTDALADPARAETAGRRGRDDMRARFSWDRTAAAFEALYAELLARR